MLPFKDTHKFIRQLAVFLVCLTLLIGCAALVLGPLATWLAGPHVIGSMPPIDQIQAVANARTSLLQFIGGAVAVGALFYNARNHLVSRRSYELSERGQVTDRYGKAVEQLASAAMQVRLGGIYALERIARDSPSDHQTIMDVLSAYIRNYTLTTDDRNATEEGHPIAPTDLQAALQVIGRRNVTSDLLPIDLRGAKLQGVELQDADLSGCYMPSADLSHSSLHRIKLRNSRLMWIDLSNAHLVEIDLSGSLLIRSNFHEAHLIDVNLDHADISDYSNLSNATLRGVCLSNAELEDVNLSGSNFSEMDFSNVCLDVTDLTGVELSETTGLTAKGLRNAIIDEQTALPYWLQFDPSSRDVVEET
jgi:uncharacterized protein YjbI with pentapeptide repeats